METSKIVTVGSYNISFVNEGFENTEIATLLVNENRSLSFWSNYFHETVLTQFNIKANKLLNIIKEFNLADIYGQANLEKGSTLANEHLLDLIESTNKEIKEMIEQKELERRAKEKATKEIETFIANKVIPEAKKLKKLLEELEDMNTYNLPTRSIYNPNEFSIIEEHFKFRAY